jgi:hypothetical protein
MRGVPAAVVLVGVGGQVERGGREVVAGAALREVEKALPRDFPVPAPLRQARPVVEDPGGPGIVRPPREELGVVGFGARTVFAGGPDLGTEGEGRAPFVFGSALDPD